MSYILITTTTDNQSKAQEIANALITQKIAACVQIDTIQSFYQREGKIISPLIKGGGPTNVGAEGFEYRLSIKTKETLYDEVAVMIRTLHNYEIPEIIATTIRYISEDYAARIDENTN